MDEVDGSFCGCGNILVGIPSDESWARASLPAAFFHGFPELNIGHDGRDIGDFVVLDPCVGWEIDGDVPKVAVESMVEGATFDIFCPVDITGKVGFSFSFSKTHGSDGLALFDDTAPIPAQVPFADGVSSVAIGLKHFGHGFSLWGKDRWFKGIDDAIEFSPVVSSR